MMIVKSFAILLLLAGPLLAADSPKEAKATPPGKVEKMIDFIKSNKSAKPHKTRHRAEKEFFVTEDEVNAYIRSWIDAEAKQARRKEVTVKSGAVHFEADHVLEADAVAQVGVSSLKQLNALGDSFWVQMLKQSLSMDNTVHLRCLLGAAKGKGFLSVQEVRIKGLPVPISLVQQILKLVGEKQHPPLDFTKPLELPNGIQKVEILPRALKLSVAPAA